MPNLFGALNLTGDTFKALNDNLNSGEIFMENSISDLSQTLTEFAGDILPYLVGIAGAFLVFWLLKLAIRVVKSVSK